MDEGPFRMPSRSTDRRTANRPEPSQPSVVEEPLPVKEEPKPVHHRTMAPPIPVKAEKSILRFILPIVAFVVVLVIIVIAWIAWPKSQTAAAAIDTSKYQAVFFTNGNVYFGKLQTYNDEYMKMTSVYYPKTQAQTTDTTKKTDTQDSQSNVTLIKLSDEIHGPEDEMIISKDQVQFFQNLRPDSKVAKLIDGQKASH